MTPEQAKALRALFPPESIGKLPRAGITLDYVGHAAVTSRLLEVDPDWTWEPYAVNEAGEPLIVTHGNVCRLWIRLTVCGVTRPGVGTVQANVFDVEKQLISDALRNAAMRFGVAVDLWSKEELPMVEVAAGPVSPPGREAGAKASSKILARESDDVPAATPFTVGQATLDALQARASALLADKAPIYDSRKAWGLPKLDENLTDEQAARWSELLSELETNVTVGKIVPA